MRATLTLLLVTLSTILVFSQDTIRILPLGNSITQAENQGMNNYNSWRRQLFMDMETIVSPPDAFDFIGTQNQAFPGVDFPDNDFDPDHEGHWGINADEVQLNLSSWLTNLDTPDVVLMHLGTNDCWDMQSVASTIAELEAIIDTLRLFNPAVTTMVAQLIPTTAAFNDCINELNAEIPTIITNKDLPGSPVILVDQNTGFDATTDTYDGVHPNEMGEDKIAARWFGSVEPVVTEILPLELVSFSANIDNRNVNINWTTVSESGIEGFEVQKSHDAKTFETLGFQPAENRASLEPTNYQFIDFDPAEGQTYYRLLILETDGQTQLSRVQLVNFQQVHSKVFPTLLRPGDPINISDGSHTSLIVRDLSGKIQYDLKQEGTLVRLPRLKPGTYFIQGDSDSGSWTKKIIIQ